MEQRMTQLHEDSLLARIAPAVFLVAATVLGGIAWGPWGGGSVLFLGCLLIYRDL